MKSTTTIAPPNLKGAQALTWQQPWTFKMTEVPDPVENRTWIVLGPPRTVLIHRGMSIDHSGYAFIEQLGHTISRKREAPGIIATAVLVDICTKSRGFHQVVCDCGPWAMPEQAHWRFADVRVLPEPVPCRGRLGLWTPEPGIMAAVAKQVRA